MRNTSSSPVLARGAATLLRTGSVIITLSLTACFDRKIASVTPEQGKVETKDLPSNPNRDADILFLIDNSGSMAEEQTSLRQNFPRFMDVLSTIEGGLPNLHIGVATSNLGMKASDGIANASFGGCTGAGDDGALQTNALITGRFIIDEELANGTRNVNYSGALADAFSALADVGTAGCGIEQHLGAIERTLTNSTNAGFLRPSAKLAVIVIADEDDCSLAHKALFEGETDGSVVNFRCTQDAIQCEHPLSEPGLLTQCEPRDTTQYLEPVDRYVSFLRGLKANPRDDVIVAGIVGDNNPFQIVLDAQQRAVLGPSCVYGGTQAAFPALRTSEFIRGFDRQVQRTICGADLTAALVEIAALLKRSFGDPCFESLVVDQDPATPGLQADCSVSDVRVFPDGSEQELATIPECGTGALPCWRIETDTRQCFYTESNLKLVIDRGGVIPPDDIHVRASCETSVDDGSFQ